jgi:hypothetical protein
MSIETDNKPEYTITRDSESKSVWINGPFNCLGRFTPLAYEIYRAMQPNDEAAASTQTLSVKITNMVPKDWNNFAELMKQHHGIDLSEENNPLL